MATEVTLCGSDQTADSSWKYICRAYTATLSVALVKISTTDLICLRLAALL